MNPILDMIIRKAWLGHYSRTSDMLEDLTSVDIDDARPAYDNKLRSRSTEALRERVRELRECCENKFGKGDPLYDDYNLGG